VLFEQRAEVGILGYDDYAGRTSSEENFAVSRITQAQISHGCAFDAERRSQPRREGRRELSIEPEFHAATIG
jgi:hypothetical protein